MLKRAVSGLARQLLPRVMRLTGRVKLWRDSIRDMHLPEALDPDPDICDHRFAVAMREVIISGVACPRCHAQPGRPCLGTKRPMRLSHIQRMAVLIPDAPRLPYGVA